MAHSSNSRHSIFMGNIYLYICWISMVNVGKYIIMHTFFVFGHWIFGNQSKSWKKNFPGTSEWGPWGQRWLGAVGFWWTCQIVKSEMTWDTLQGTSPYPTKREKESHLQKRFLMGKVSFREEKIGVFPLHVENIPWEYHSFEVTLAWCILCSMNITTHFFLTILHLTKNPEQLAHIKIEWDKLEYVHQKVTKT